MILLDLLCTIYKKYNYKIFESKDGYIVYNTRLKFESHHTHITDLNTCKFIIDLCIKKMVPHKLSDYLLVSIIRITDDKNYKEKIKNMLNDPNRKKKKRYNNINNIPKNINRRKNNGKSSYGSSSTSNGNSKGRRKQRAC